MAAKRRVSVRKLFPIVASGYVLIQVFAAWRAYTGLGLEPYAIPLMVAWIALMTLSLRILRRLEHAGWHRSATTIAWTSFIWMGSVFTFFWVALGLDVLGLAVAAAAAATNHALALPGPAISSFPVAAGLTLLVVAYGFVDARRVRVERVRIATPKLSPGSAPLRLALISDVHLGVLVGARRLGRILARLKQLDADAVISVGDLVDGLEHRLRALAPMFEALRPRLGKYAVTGNHEYYAGIQHSLAFHKRAGFTLLRGTTAELTPEITLAGVDDVTSRGPHTDERVPLLRVPQDRFTILLKHQPVWHPGAEALFDLQLSGHVHRGQIFPFGLLVRLVYPVRTGLTRLAERAWIYVSRGTGTWGPPIRVGAPPEIALIEIVPAEARAAA